MATDERRVVDDKQHTHKKVFFLSHTLFLTIGTTNACLFSSLPSLAFSGTVQSLAFQPTTTTTTARVLRRESYITVFASTQLACAGFFKSKAKKINVQKISDHFSFFYFWFQTVVKSRQKKVFFYVFVKKRHHQVVF